MAFLYSAEPFLIATKPFTPSSFLAFWTASVQALMCLYAFLPAACCLLLTTLPVLLFMRSDFFRPVYVFSLPPRNTLAFIRLPFAIVLTFFAFMAFMAFIAFIAFMAFMAFIANAMIRTVRLLEAKSRS